MPIGFQALGGDAKMLMIIPEMDYIHETIINSLGVPIEFIKGGSTWTSSSVSLRIVENHFLTYREQLEDFLNHFLANKIHTLIGYPEATLRMVKFKMLDDAETKNQIFTLNQSGKISDQTLLSEYGYDNKLETRLRQLEMKLLIDSKTAELLAQAEANRQVVTINARAQAEGTYALQEETFRIRERLFADELLVELKAGEQDPSDILEKMCIQYMGVDPKEFSKIAKQAPTTFHFLMLRLQALGGIPEEVQEPEKPKPEPKGKPK
jgi:predicted house-cleaning noncanonical NTP pyrophosphatase (MazG superfamily)